MRKCRLLLSLAIPLAFLGGAFGDSNLPNVLPIPGTASVRHLQENLASAWLPLSDDDMAALDRAGKLDQLIR